MATRDSKVTLKEIANRAGVSPSLVSCILNGRQRASQDVQDRVVAMLAEAGYKPKYARRPFLLLLDSPDSEARNEHFELEAGIQSLLREEGCSLLVEFVPTEGAGEFRDASIENILRRCAQRRPGGVFVSSKAYWLLKAGSIFSEEGIPFVQTGFDVENPNYNGVVVDSFSGAYKAARHLVGMGHSRIATIRWTARGVFNANQKHAGFLAGLADGGITPRPEYIREIRSYPHDPDWVLPRYILDEMLQLPEPPTALFVENSVLSVSLLYPVPEDGGCLPAEVQNVTKIHFEDLHLDHTELIVANELGYPPRDTYMMSVDWHAMGRTAARVMVDLAGSPSVLKPRSLRLSPVLQRVVGRKRTVLDESFFRPQG